MHSNYRDVQSALFQVQRKLWMLLMKANQIDMLLLQVSKIVFQYHFESRFLYNAEI